MAHKGTRSKSYLRRRKKREEGKEALKGVSSPKVKKPDEEIKLIGKKKDHGIVDRAATYGLNVLKSPKTTAFLATTLAALLSGGAAAGALRGAGAVAKGGVSRAVSIRSISAHWRNPLTGKLAPRGTQVIQRAFKGRPAASGIDKIFHKVRPIAARFPTNSKTTGLTTSFFKKFLKVATSPTVLLGAIGSYPFAGFIKEEAIQQIGFGFNEAERNNNIEGMEMAVAETEDILNNQDSIMDAVPYANILKELSAFFDAAQVKLVIDKQTLEKKRGELSGDIETQFGIERREVDEAARQRDLAERARDAEYFRLIREGKFEEADELLNREIEGGEMNG